MVAVVLAVGDSVTITVVKASLEVLTVTVTSHEHYLGVKYQDTEYCSYFASDVPSMTEVQK
jgi:hypothetical protein